MKQVYTLKNSAKRNKMAAEMYKKNILKLVKDVTVTSSILLSFQMQFYGLLTLYKMFD